MGAVLHKEKIIKKEENVKDYLDIYKIHLEGGGEYPPPFLLSRRVGENPPSIHAYKSAILVRPRIKFTKNLLHPIHFSTWCLTLRPPPLGFIGN